MRERGEGEQKGEQKVLGLFARFARYVFAGRRHEAEVDVEVEAVAEEEEEEESGGNGEWARVCVERVSHGFTTLIYNDPFVLTHGIANYHEPYRKRG